MTHHQSGSVDYNSWDYDPYRRRRHYYDDYDDEEDEEPDTDGSSDAEFEDVVEDSLTLDHWLDAKGRPQPFGSLSLDEREIVSDVAPEDRPYRQEIYEACRRL
jgi:hypothetical protein